MRRPRSRWKTVRGRLGWYVVREDNAGQFVGASGPHLTREEARSIQRTWTGCDDVIFALHRDADDSPDPSRPSTISRAQG